ncbi:hypothetical protein BBD46_02525 [Natrialba sp. SSL1]|nr:hypothetical protein BBD46_02525 [Natrialba sp. SSL1]
MLLALGTWLQEEVPESEDAQLLMLDAVTILDREGPLSTSELRERLFDQGPTNLLIPSGRQLSSDFMTKLRGSKKLSMECMGSTELQCGKCSNNSR